MVDDVSGASVYRSIVEPGLGVPIICSESGRSHQESKEDGQEASLQVVFMRSSLKERLNRLLAGAVLEVSARD